MMNYNLHNVNVKREYRMFGMETYQIPFGTSSEANQYSRMPDIPDLNEEYPGKWIKEFIQIPCAVSRGLQSTIPLRLEWIKNKLNQIGVHFLHWEDDNKREDSSSLVVPFIDNPTKQAVLYIVPYSDTLFVNGYDMEYERASSTIMGLLLAARLKAGKEPKNAILIFTKARDHEFTSSLIIEWIRTGKLQTRISSIVELGIFSGPYIGFENEDKVEEKIWSAILNHSKGALIIDNNDYGSEL